MVKRKGRAYVICKKTLTESNNTNMIAQQFVANCLLRLESNQSWCIFMPRVQTNRSVIK